MNNILSKKYTLVTETNNSTRSWHINNETPLFEIPLLHQSTIGKDRWSPQNSSFHRSHSYLIAVDEIRRWFAAPEVFQVEELNNKRYKPIEGCFTFNSHLSLT